VSDQLGDSASGTVAVTIDSNLLGNYRITLTGAVGSGNTIAGGNGNDQVALTGNNNTVMLDGGNDHVMLTGNSNNAALGNGDDQVALTGNNNTLTLGGGNDNVTVSGNGNTALLGVDNSISAGTGHDSFTLGGSGTTLALHGLHDTVSVNGGTESIIDTPGGTDSLTLQVGALGGNIGVADFSIAHGVLVLVQTLAASQGWTTAGQIDAALTTDNHGGTLLSLGAHGSIDFQGIAKSQLSANNFHIN
jgi:hypothetical protein